MKIKVRLSDAGLEQAEKDIRKYKTALNTKAQQFARALAEKGLAVAKIRFANAKYSGNNDVVCEINQKGSTCTILAKGQAVAFIEFGTGVAHPAYGGELPTGVGEHGTYGKGNGKRDHWSYYGDPGNDANTVTYNDKGTLVITDGNDAAMAMWGAVEEMASQVEATWREVWSS